MNLLLPVVLMCGLFTTGNSQKIKFADCGTQLSTITEVAVFPCPSLPCLFKKNTNVTFTINFIPNTILHVATLQIYGIIRDLPVPFTMPDSNACNYLQCPLTPGIPVTYNNFVYVDPGYPSNITLTVKVELTSFGDEIVCVTLPVHLE